jgi:putative cardiolipin synthase
MIKLSIFGVTWLLVAAAVFYLASLAAHWSHRRFAGRAKGVASQALPRSGPPTALDDLFAPIEQEHPAQDGLLSLFENTDAFAARSVSAQLTGRSLDLMYYYWSADLTGWLLVRDLLGAADRGVRVRLLLDDAHVSGLDAIYLALSRHPQIEIRLFNPTRIRGNTVHRAVELLLGLARFNRRMHCKTWIADGRLAIVGGRNIDDAYFGEADASKANTRDADIMLVGPKVAQVETVFDEYWNSGLALPIAKLSPSIRVNLKAIRRRFGRKAKSTRARAFSSQAPGVQDAVAILTERLRWTDTVRVVADPPEKAYGARPKPWMAETIRSFIMAAKSDVKLTTPYFVPGASGMADLTRLAERGVKISLLTNGLSATDVLLVHGAYRRYRLQLLQAGVRLFEFSPPKLVRRKRDFLHSKVFVVDQKTAFIGSFNFDLRSAFMNTEMGILFDQPDLIAELFEVFNADTALGTSYALSLQGNTLQWNGPDLQSVYTTEPEARWLKRGVSWLVGHLPIQSYL